jgi:hypothetical protein
MLEWILRRVREEETVVMMRMFPPTVERKNHLYKKDVGVNPARVREEETVVMMRMSCIMESKNHLYKEDV